MANLFLKTMIMRKVEADGAGQRVTRWRGRHRER